MRAFNIGNAQHYTAIVHGYASPGDDGGGVFHWSTDPKRDDGGTIVAAVSAGLSRARSSWESGRHTRSAVDALSGHDRR